jgi:beta-glucosidase
MVTNSAWSEQLEPAAPGPLSPEQIEGKARALLAQMTLADKIGQMTGDDSYWDQLVQFLRGYNSRPITAGKGSRLGIPAIRFSDGPRGVVMYHSTCFPVSMARGASWDVELEERIGDAIGVEARAQGANFYGGVCINLLRHPAWGRAQETYGEDPYHLGEMGAALVRGVQRHVMACAKHYAANSIENARFKVDVRVSERVLREVYLPHFKRCVDEGVAAVMSAYNQVNGAYCGHNIHLLRDILKGEWGFQGLVMSDFFWGLRDGKAGALAGLDVEMPVARQYGPRLQRLVEAGEVPLVAVDEAVLRILRCKMQFAFVGEPDRYQRQAVAGEVHRALARESARKSMVLLKNVPVEGRDHPFLPLDSARLRRIALIGRLAAVPNVGDLRGSSTVRPPHVVTPREGLQAALDSTTEIDYRDGRDLRRAAEAARAADVALVFAGFTSSDEGEYVFHFPGQKERGDRVRLVLSPKDEALILAVAEANPSTAVVLMGGSAIITETWREQVPAILMAWYPGMEGGHALADILLGRANPSGKLPCAFPRSESQLPFFDRHAASIEYGLLHGYRLMDREGETPAFPFGFGLSYTTFEYRDLHADRPVIGEDEALRVSVEIANTGAVAGEEVAQLYAGCEGSQVERPVKELKGFARVRLEPGEARRVAFDLPARHLAYHDEREGRWIVEPARYRVFVGPSSVDLLQAEFRVTAAR